MKKYIFLCGLLLALVSCGTPASEMSVGTPTNVNPAEIAATMMQNQMAAKATEGAVSIQMSATAQIVGVTATSYAIGTEVAITQQARRDAEATAEQKRMDIQATQARMDLEATQVQARLDMEATAEQSRLDMQATQQAVGTATAFTITQTAIPPANTMTAIAHEQAIALANNQVELSNLAVEQQREKNTPEWVVPFLIAISLTAVTVLYVIRYSRVREIKNDDGGIELLILDGNKGIRPKLLPGPVLEFGDQITMPLLTSPLEQARVTERAQAVEAISAMPASTTPQSAQTFNRYFGQRRDEMFEVIDGDELPPASLLDGETVKSLEKDWKDAHE